MRTSVVACVAVGVEGPGCLFVIPVVGVGSMGRTVELRIAGQNVRVVSSAPEEDLRHLAEVVNGKLAEVIPRGRGAPPHAMLLAAMALAHDAELERGRRQDLERRTRNLLGRTLARIDAALENTAPEAQAP